MAARNVLVNDQDIAKVADFGLAKRSDWGDIDSGKLPIKWTAPEVMKHKVSTSKSDGKLTRAAVCVCVSELAEAEGVIDSAVW